MTECRCDRFEHPSKLCIPTGLSNIPRQIAGFPEFRRAMLAAIRRFSALHNWRARGDDDFGIMLLEMWAYVADVQSFYDEVLAHEAYLRTARQRSSLRKLVGLLGYVPRPAISSTVELAIFAEGRRPLTIPRGTAFRSGAFGEEAPQVFELKADTWVHPLANQWQIAARRSDTIGTDPGSSHFSHLLLETSGTSIKKGDVVLVRCRNNQIACQVRTAGLITEIEGRDGSSYKRLTFDAPIILPWDVPVAEIELTSPTQSGGLWTLKLRPDEPAINGLPTKGNWTDDVPTLQLKEEEKNMKRYFPNQQKKPSLL